MQTSDPTDDLRQNINEDEELQWVVAPSLTAMVAGKIPGSLITGAILGVLVGGGIGVYTGDVVLGAVGFLAMIVLLVGIAVLSVYTYNIEYAATDQRLINYHGRFGRSLSSIPFAGIQDAEYTISAIENLYGVGTVSVDTHRGYETMRFPKTPDPEDFAREVVSIAQSAESSESQSTDSNV